MKIFCNLLIIFSLMVFVSGCASKEAMQEGNKEKLSQEKLEKEVEKSEESKFMKIEPVEKPLPEVVSVPIPESSPTIVPESVPTPIQTKQNFSKSLPEDTRWILVFKTNELIEPAERADILNALKEKWLKEKVHVEMTPEDFDIEKMVGKIVVSAEARRSYGKYEFTIRTGKMVLDGKDVVEVPLSKEEGPDCLIDNRASVDDLLREIRFAE